VEDAHHRRKSSEINPSAIATEKAAQKPTTAFAGLGNGTSAISEAHRPRNESRDRVADDSRRRISGEVAKIQQEMLDLRRATQEDNRQIRQMLEQLLEKEGLKAGGRALSPGDSKRKMEC